MDWDMAVISMHCTFHIVFLVSIFQRKVFFFDHVIYLFLTLCIYFNFNVLFIQRPDIIQK